MPKKAPPAVGTVEGGFSYQGGDPSKRESWVQVTTGPNPPTPKPEARMFQRHPANMEYRDISKREGPAQLAERQRLAEKIGGDVTAGTVGAATAVLPFAPGAPGAIAGAAGRGLTAMEGAKYGGGLSSSLGLGKLPGQIVGGVGGALAPEAIQKMGGPLISKIASALGRSAPEAAAGAEAAGAAAPNVEAGYSKAGLYTPRSSAAETGMWHAGQGAAPSPYETDTQTLLQKLREAGVTPESEQGRDILMQGYGRARPLRQGSALVDPTTFEKGYK
jgi:hypothetical protein